jgi:Kef-type K+ transport system membrane component KefB
MDGPSRNDLRDGHRGPAWTAILCGLVQPHSPPTESMPHAITTTELYLIAMAIIFCVPYLIWRLGRTDYFAPLVVVQILTGILLGPGVLGAAFPDYYDFIFTRDVVQSLNGLAWWAVMLFVWLAGIELDLGEAWKQRRESTVTAGMALGMPLVFGSIAALALVQFPGWIGERAQTWQFVLGIGMAAAVTALPILVLLMEKMEILRTPLGQRILRYASLDDIAIWAVLAIVVMDWGRLERQAIFIAAFVPACWAFRKLMIRLPERDRWYIALIWLAVVSFGADWSGLHYMVGAFLAGVVVDHHWFDRDKLDSLRHNVLLVMMPVFFLSTGLRTSWEVGGAVVFLAAGFLLAMQIAGKQAGVRIAGRLLGWKPGEASIIAWLLQTKALIEIIFATVLLDKGIITSATFTALLLMALASTMLTVPIVTPKLQRMRELISRGA